MRIVLFTGNERRHIYFANRLTSLTDDALVISEVRPQYSGDSEVIAKHFRLRAESEDALLHTADCFISRVVPIAHGEVNSQRIVSLISDYSPRGAFVFGASIIGQELIKQVPSGCFVNLHLGLSPYYRGSGTLLWAWLNGDYWAMGSTIMHLDEGIDTGDIIEYVVPPVHPGDTIHSAGCRVVHDSVSRLCEIYGKMKRGEDLPRTPQMKVQYGHCYRRSDFTEDVADAVSALGN